MRLVSGVLQPGNIIVKNNRLGHFIKNKRAKESTPATYKKRLLLFKQRFFCLPENPEAIIDYLTRFDGESGRHRRNQQDLLNMLYEHAIRRFSLPKNPVAELESPSVKRKPVRTLSLEQVRALDSTPQNLQERTALDLFPGHGWRQIEIKQVQAKDVAAIEHQMILCHGKEREELAPLLPETEERLREMAQRQHRVELDSVKIDYLVFMPSVP
jgi:site-specific recombinase XerD